MVLFMSSRVSSGYPNIIKVPVSIPMVLASIIASFTLLMSTRLSILSMIFWEPLSAPIHILKQPAFFNSWRISVFNRSARVIHSKGIFTFCFSVSWAKLFIHLWLTVKTSSTNQILSGLYCFWSIAISATTRLAGLRL